MDGGYSGLLVLRGIVFYFILLYSTKILSVDVVGHSSCPQDTEPVLSQQADGWSSNVVRDR